MTARGEFVKSATTTVSVAKSQAEIMATLARYHASGFGFRKRGSVVSVTFHLPRAKGDTRADHEVEIPVDLTRVRDRLNAPAIARKRASMKQASTVSPDQVERVAWRLLVLWLDAALAAVSLGAQTIEEAFFAHIVVTDSDGRRGRSADYLASLEAIRGGSLPALPGEWNAGVKLIGPGGA